MWMNSPLPKWDQDARVKKAHRDAERLRVEEEAGDADGEAKRDTPLVAEGGLHWLAARARAAVESMQTRFAGPAAPRD